MEVKGQVCKSQCDFTDALRLNSFIFHIHDVVQRALLSKCLKGRTSSFVGQVFM